jgi:hypothetical protein
VPAVLVLLLSAAAANAGDVTTDAPAATATAMQVTDEGPIPTTPIRRRLRLPDPDTLTWSACLGFARIGSLMLWEVVEDDLWTLGLLTAAGAGIGFALGALVLGGAFVALGVALLAAGLVTVPWLWVALGAAGVAVGGTAGLLTGLPVGASVGLAASIDEGELTLQF